MPAMKPQTILTKLVARGVTQDEIAAYLGVNQSTVSRWLRGEREADHMRTTTSQRLAMMFKARVER